MSIVRIKDTTRDMPTKKTPTQTRRRPCSHGLMGYQNNVARAAARATRVRVRSRRRRRQSRHVLRGGVITQKTIRVRQW